MTRAGLLTLLCERWEDARRAGSSLTPEQLCRDHPDLLDEVRRAVAALSVADRAMDTSAGADTVLADDLPTAPPGFDLLSELGRGGMGVVYRARDRRLGREVAVKVLRKPYPPRSSVGRRFVEEARITGRLQHPGVPAVHQVGTLPDGRPYLAMRLIAGDTLADLLTARPDLGHDRGRFVAAFEAVCQAVGYAHAQGVIHRDLKPQNVMVGAFGEVQVMDWGLARMRSGEVGMWSEDDSLASANVPSTPPSDFATPPSDLTQAGDVMGTPAFMAPEQARGEVADARADVFALGGILTAILTGKAVFESHSAADTIRTAAAGDTADALLRLTACGADADLVAIATACLRADREARPADGLAVAKLVADYRDGVEERLKQAQADRAAAVVREAEQKKRRRVQAWAAGVIAAVLLAGIIGTTLGLFEAWDAREAERRRAESELAAKVREATARGKAENAYAKTATVLDLMVSEITGEALAAQRTVSPDQMKFLSGVLPYYQEFAVAGGSDEHGRARAARASYRVGLIQERLGRMPEAVAAFENTARLYRDLATDFPTGRYSGDLANCHTNLGVMLKAVGRLADAEAAYRAALAAQQAGTAADPARPDLRRDAATSHNNLGALLAETGNAVEAEKHYRQALALQEKLADDYPRAPEYRRNIASSHNNLGALCNGSGEPAEAEKHYRRALALLDKLADDYPGAPDYQQDAGRTWSNLGVVLADSGRRADAEAAYRKALVHREKLAANYPAVPDCQFDVAVTRSNLGVLLDELDRRADADAEHRRAIAITEKLATDYHARPEFRQHLATSRTNLAALLAKMNRPADAEAEYRKGMAIQEKLVADFPGNDVFVAELGETYGNLGLHLLNGRKAADARAWLRKAIDTLRPIREKRKDDPQVQQAWRNANQNLIVAEAELQGK